MTENKKSYDKNEVIVLVLKILVAVAAVAAAIFAAIKIYEKIQSKRICSICECEDEDYFCDDEDFCDCDECQCEMADDVAENA